jgi:hypothetical protein
MENFDLEPPQNCIIGKDSLVTSHQSLRYVLDQQDLNLVGVNVLRSFSKNSTHPVGYRQPPFHSVPVCVCN